jgi:hypothetical protein
MAANGQQAPVFYRARQLTQPALLPRRRGPPTKAAGGVSPWLSTCPPAWSNTSHAAWIDVVIVFFARQ